MFYIRDGKVYQDFGDKMAEVEVTVLGEKKVEYIPRGIDVTKVGKLVTKHEDAQPLTIEEVVAKLNLKPVDMATFKAK